MQQGHASGTSLLITLFCDTVTVHGGEAWLGSLARRLGVYRSGISRRRFACLLSLLFAVVYAALAGFSLPTLRALLMLVILLAGLQLNRRMDLLYCASAALAIRKLRAAQPAEIF